MIRAFLITISTSGPKMWSTIPRHLNLSVNGVNRKLWKLKGLPTWNRCCKVRLLYKRNKKCSFAMFLTDCHIRANQFKICKIYQWSKMIKCISITEMWKISRINSCSLQLNLPKMMPLHWQSIYAKTGIVRIRSQSSKRPLKSKRATRSMTYLKKRWCTISCLNGWQRSQHHQEGLPLNPKDWKVLVQLLSRKGELANSSPFLKTTYFDLSPLLRPPRSHDDDVFQSDF